MSQKALLIINQDPLVKDLCDQIASKRQALKERIGFVKKQADDAHDQYERETQKLWDGLEEHLAKVGLLPADYNKKKHSISFGDAGVLLLEDNEQSGISDLLKSLLR